MNFIFIYVTASSLEEAKYIADHLLKERLIACANIFPINSVYRWRGKIKEEQETVLILKTTEDKYITIVDEVTAIHSYETPCITKIRVEPNTTYTRWLLRQISTTTHSKPKQSNAKNKK